MRPLWTTLLVSLLIVAIGAARSLLRKESWFLADNITTTRLGLIIVFSALALLGTGFSWFMVGIGSVALALDTCDGFVARRTIITAAGASYDEAVDALFVLILSVALTPLWGVWVILPGLFYYVFRSIAHFRLTWRRRLPPSQLRKTIAAAQGILLLTAGSPLAQAHSWLGFLSASTAIAALVYSFGRDVLWLERQPHQTVSRQH